MHLLLGIVLLLNTPVAGPAFELASEQSLDSYGGIPFCADLDGDGDTDILWLQSPGIFHYRVFNKLLAGRFDKSGRELLIYTDGGWPYVLNGRGRRCAWFHETK